MLWLLVGAVLAAPCSLTGLWVIPSLQWRQDNLMDPAVYVTINVTMTSDQAWTAKCLMAPSVCNFTAVSGSLSWPNIASRYVVNDRVVSDSGVAYENCNEIVWGQGDAGTMWHRVMPAIKTVHIVYMTHLDVGYTLLTSVDVEKLYFKTYFPQSYVTSSTLRAAGGPARFRWTTHPWLVHQMLNNVTGTVTPQQINDFRAAVARDDITWHAGPFNMEAELTDPSLFGYGVEMAHALDAMFNKTQKTVVSQKDVPGTTIGIVPVLAKKGVKAIHVGVNDFCTPPAVPFTSPQYHSRCHTFVWRHNVDGVASEVIAYWCSGYSQGATQPEMIVDDVPGFSEALVFLMHVDNTGPHLPNEARQGWDAVQQLYPNAQLVLSSLDNFTAALDPHRGALPVLENKEVGDSWIYGAASDPIKMRYYRTLARLRVDALQKGEMSKEDPRVFAFSRSLIKLAEHTWGNNNGQLWGVNYTNGYFDTHVNSQQFQWVVQASMDQRAYIQDALTNLADHPLRPTFEAALKATDPQKPDVAQYTPMSVDSFVATTWTCGVTTVAFDRTGAVSRFVGSLGRVVEASTAGGVGGLLYRTHSEAQFAAFVANYSLNIYRNANLNVGFDKIGMDGQQHDWPVTLSNAYYIPASDAAPEGAAGSACSFLLNVTTVDAEARTRYGAPPSVLIKVDVAPQDRHRKPGPYDAIAYDVQWFGKRPTREAESLWFSFAPAVADPRQWRIHKLGQWLSPYDVVANGTVNTHGVWDGIRYLTLGGESAFEVEGTDTPLLAVTDPMPVLYRSGGPADVNLNGGLHFCLFNNAWSTNYPLWTLDTDARFRFQLRVF